MGLFTDAYDLFCIAPVLSMLSEIYYKTDSIGTPLLSTFYVIALLGAALAPSAADSPSAPLAGLASWPVLASLDSSSGSGLGILMSSAVTMSVCSAFKKAGERSSEKTRAEESDIAWRLILMIGAIPAALTFYWRMRMPETASLHGLDLFAASANWFLVDVVFYTSNLLLSQIVSLSNKPSSTANVYDSAFEAAKVAAIVAACSTIPGYWFTVYFIDRIGRVKIQIMGFFFMAVVYLAAGIPYSWYWLHEKTNNKGFMILYGSIFFFSNFGPNTTTFIVPAELFPARFRSTCHGISGAFGKLGAIAGTVGFLWGTKHDEEHKDVFLT
ncbi:hypothetical protein Bca52824_084716 [Brassica carinata]|uniref:Phosphate transporter n=1 Tax=Brassica carinata TaxID=52824 RepID=A0A8X7TTY6_BRACI|nr:hypothetical protein Bca52824_084716 [Brassica carinata]